MSGQQGAAGYAPQVARPQSADVGASICRKKESMLKQPRDYHHTYELLLAVGVFILVNIASFLCQDRITYNSGRGWDGVVYYNIAEQFSRGQLPDADAPFVYRIGTPFLASLIARGDLLAAFWLINVLANAVTVFLLWVFFRMHLRDWRIRIALLVLFMTQWHGPIRFVYLYPAYVDPFFFVFLIAGLILVTKLKSSVSVGSIVALVALMFIGVTFREAVLMVALTVPFIVNPITTDLLQWKQMKQNFTSVRVSFLLPAVAGICGLVVTHLLATQANNYSFLRTAHWWAYGKPLPGYILAWFIAFGPVLAVTLYDIRGCWTFLMRQQHLLIFILGFSVLAWVGGSDTDRILYWSMPVVYVLTGKAIERQHALLRSVPILATLTILQAISQRMFWATPDFPNPFSHKVPFLTHIGRECPMLDLYSYHAHQLVQSVSLLQYALCTIVILLCLYNRSIKRNNCANHALDHTGDPLRGSPSGQG